MVFSLVIYGCESWAIQKVEHWRIYAFELWCWRRCLRIPWTARSNQSILKEISPKYSLEGLMLKLKLQYFGHLLQWADSFKKTLMLPWLRAGGEGDDIGWDGSPTWRHGFGWTQGFGDGQGGWCAAVNEAAKISTRLSDWTELNWTETLQFVFLLSYQVIWMQWSRDHTLRTTGLTQTLHLWVWKTVPAKLIELAYSSH